MINPITLRKPTFCEQKQITDNQEITPLKTINPLKNCPFPHLIAPKI
jgi:hypothetical protein